MQSYAEWRPEARAVVDFELADSVPALSDVEDTSLVAEMYRGTTLIWP